VEDGGASCANVAAGVIGDMGGARGDCEEDERASRGFEGFMVGCGASCDDLLLDVRLEGRRPGPAEDGAMLKQTRLRHVTEMLNLKHEVATSSCTLHPQLLSQYI
jgi:hypothetical protein